MYRSITYTIMVTVAIATGLTSYIPMMYAEGLQVCRLLKRSVYSSIIS